MLSDEDIAAGTVPFLAELGVELEASDPVLLKSIPYVRPRAATFIDVADAVIYFFRDVELEEKAKRKFLVPANAENLRALAGVVQDVEPFDAEALEAAVKTWMEANDLPMKSVAQPARVAMTGRTRSPGLFEVMEVLGKARTVERLRSGADVAAENVPAST